MNKQNSVEGERYDSMRKSHSTQTEAMLGVPTSNDKGFRKPHKCN